MTATNDAPDPTTSPAHDPWQHIEDRLTAIEHRVRLQGSATTAAIDACLARLDSLRNQLTHGPWPPSDLPAPPQPESAPTPAVRPDTRRRTTVRASA